jgi:hypothetical protein
MKSHHGMVRILDPTAVQVHLRLVQDALRDRGVKANLSEIATVALRNAMPEQIASLIEASRSAVAS